MSADFRSKPVIALTNIGAWLLAILWVLPLLYAFWTAFHPADSRPVSISPRPGRSRTSCGLGKRRHSPAISLNTFVLVTRDPDLPVRHLHAGRLRLRLFPLPRVGSIVHAGSGATDDHAGGPAGGELPHPFAVRPARHHRSASRFPILRQPLASSCSARPSRAFPRNSRRQPALEGANAHADPAAGVHSGRQADVYCLRPGHRLLSLEQLPVAAGRDQLGRDTARSPSALQVFATSSRASTGVWSPPPRYSRLTPLLVAFLLFQRQFVQSFMRAGIR